MKKASFIDPKDLQKLEFDESGADTVYVDRNISASIGIQKLSCDIKTIELTATIL